MDSTQANALIDSLQKREVGGWRIEGSLGFGKSAVVLVGVKDGTRAAVKVFHPELVERYGREVQLERIRREKLLIGATHPNLVKIFDGGECSVTGCLFVVMEEVPFPNMKDVLPTIPVAAIRGLLSQLASAAMFLEERGLAHRDIKPENIAVDVAASRLILLDLGVLRPFGIANLTDVNQRPFIGTLRYSSPEFLRREESDTPEGWRAITVYQIGAVLHDLLMRREIFADKSEPYSVLVEAVLHDRPEVYGDDPALIRICNHCLVKNPKTRLELVKWGDFQEPNGKASADSLRDKIKARQQYFRSVASDSPTTSDAVRRMKNALTDVANRVDTRVGVALNALACFPPKTSVASVDVEKSAATVSIRFESDKQLGLDACLALAFRAEVIDENSGKEIWKISSAAAIAPTDVEEAPFTDYLKFFVGDVDELLASSAIEEELMRILDAAYALLDTMASGAIKSIFFLNN